jgi:uncharacterized delta-60 repeat protein
MRVGAFGVIAAATAMTVLLAGAATATAGDLDPTFGSGGTKQLTDQYGHLGLGSAVLDDSGRTLVGVHSAHRTFLIRLDTDGQRDQTYGQHGVVELPGPARGGHLVARPGGGFLLLAAQDAASGDAASTWLLALTSEGLIDTSYGSNGVATAPATAAHDRPIAVGVTTDGSAIVAQDGYQPTGWRLIRFTPTGQRDVTFGGGGILATPWPGQATPWGVTALPAGAFLVVGSDSPHGTGSLAAAAEYNADGSLVDAYGVHGRALYSFPGRNAYARRALRLASGDLVIAVDTVVNGGAVQVVLLRTHAHGGPDTGFGTNGQADVGAAIGEAGVGGFLLDGSTVVIDRAVHVGPFTSAIDRVDAATGAADSSFGTNGEVVIEGGLVSVFGIDDQRRLYDSGYLDRSFGPIGVVQRRVNS